MVRYHTLDNRQWRPSIVVGHVYQYAIIDRLDTLRLQCIVRARMCCSTSVKSYCPQQRLSMDSLQNLLRSTMATIYRYQVCIHFLIYYIVGGKGYRQIHFEICCDRQWLSINTSLSLLWPAMAIDGHHLQYIEVDYVYRWTSSPAYFHTNNEL